MLPFLAIGSLREFYGGGLLAELENYDDRCQRLYRDLPALGANLETVELAGACMDPERLSLLVRNMAKLRTFRMSQECKWHGICYDWEPGRFAHTLMRLVGDTLEELSLTTIGMDGDVLSGIASLRGFSSLKRLELGTWFFQGPTYHPDFELPKEDDRYDPYEFQDRPHVVPRLVDILPPTLEKLHLLSNVKQDPSDVLEALFDGFAAGRKASLPRLEHAAIKIGHGFSWQGPPSRRPKREIVPFDLPPSVQEAVDEAGVELIEYEGDADADFMQDFYSRFDVDASEGG
jgi:hypothetical protein